MFALAVASTAMFLPASVPQGQAQIVADTGEIVPAWGETAALVIGAPLVIDATIRSGSRITGPEAAAVPAGFARFYLTADVQALVRGSDALPARIGWLADLPLDARGRPPRIRKDRVMLFARPIAGRPGDVQLTRIEGQQRWTPGYDAQVRGIVRDLLAPDAPPAITGAGNAFHVPGTLPGEGETQVFLLTESGAPVSLTILRRPGQERRWAVSLGEIVDQAAEPPPRDTLLWYRLACGLPAQLPADSLAAEAPENAAIARDDYAFVRRAVGACPAR